MASGKKVLILLVSALLAAGIYFIYNAWHSQGWRDAYAAAMRLYAEKKYAEAADALRAVSAAHPRAPEGIEAFYYYCLCLEMSGQRQKARGALQKIIADPGSRKYHPHASLALARLSIQENRDVDAKGYLDGLIESYAGSPVCADGFLLRAELLEREGDLAAAARATQKVIDEYPGSSAIGKAQDKVWGLNIKLLFSGQLAPGTEEYLVRQGDSLESIARKFGTTVELLKEMNGQAIKGDSIRQQDRIKVYTEKFSLLVDKSANTLTLKAGERVVKVYPVGSGKGGSTPVGDFKITNKMVEPEWFRPGGGVIPYGDPGNLLGTRWMGIDSPGYGIHGTWEPETVGKQASAGCIRLLNADVEELFKIVPVGTRVMIVE